MNPTGNSGKHEPDSNDFWAWAIEKGRRTKTSVAVLGTLLLFFFNTAIPTVAAMPEWTRTLVPKIANALLAIAAIYLIGREDRNTLRRTADADVRPFRRVWQYTWCGWLLLYVAMSFSTAIRGASANDANTSNTYHLISLLALIQTGVLFQAQRYLALGFASAESRIVSLQSVAFFAVLGILRATVWLAPAPVSGGYAGLCAALALIEGLTAAIVLNQFAGRLDSRIIGLPSLVLQTLYCYGALQPVLALAVWQRQFRPEWSQTNLTSMGFTLGAGYDLLIASAFSMKLCFFASVQWTLDQRILSFYFLETEKIAQTRERRLVVHAKRASHEPGKTSVRTLLTDDLSSIGAVFRMIASRLPHHAPPSLEEFREWIRLSERADFASEHALRVHPLAVVIDERPVGFMLLVVSIDCPIAFVSYLVTTERDPEVTQALLRQAKTLLIGQEHPFPTVVFEIDKPDGPRKQQRTRTARIRQFMRLSSLMNYQMAIIDLPYSHPPFKLDWSNISNRQMLLGIARPAARLGSHISRKEVIEIIDFLGTKIYRNTNRLANAPDRANYTQVLQDWRSELLSHVGQSTPLHKPIDEKPDDADVPK